MNRNEPRFEFALPRGVLGALAVAMAAFTLYGMVVMPAHLEDDCNRPPVAVAPAPPGAQPAVAALPPGSAVAAGDASTGSVEGSCGCLAASAGHGEPTD